MAIAWPQKWKLKLPQTSLALRLTTLLFFGLVVTGTVAVWMTYATTQAKVEDLFDSRLREYASFLVQITPDPELLELEPVHQQPLSSSGYERQLSYRIWNREGLLLTESHNAPDTSFPAREEGFFTLSDSRNVWNGVSVFDDSKGLSVVVLEDSVIRRALVQDIALSTVWRWLITAPILALVIFWLLKRGLKPLHALGVLLQNRDPQKLEPIHEGVSFRELEPLVNAINALFARVSQVLLLLKRFTGEAAHELRTPLATIRIQTEAAQKDPTRLTHVIEGVDRAARLIDKLLVLARLDEQQSIQTQPLSLLEHSQKALQQWSMKAARKAIDLSFEHQGRAEIAADADLIAILFNNLIDNALRHTSAGGEITVSISETAEQWVWRIANTGAVVQEHEWERLGERFFRASNRQGEGSGLGLSIVQKITELHQASIDFEPLIRNNQPQGMIVSIGFAK